MVEASSKLAFAIPCMLLLAALYEPMRMALYRFGAAVGGVGGVGGLCNMGDPRECESLAGKVGAYCYETGIIAGFTPMALVVLGAWILPLMLGSIRIATATCIKPVLPVRSLSGRETAPEESAQTIPLTVDWFAYLWLAVECMWFIVPATLFLASPFYQSDWVHVVLGIAIAASYPLSWHLALVAVPISQVVAPALGVPSSSVVAFHKLVGWHCVRWASVHAGGELIWYIFKDHGLWYNLSLRQNGEHFINIMGLITAGTLAVHAIVTAVRKQAWLQPYFKNVHRAIAIVVLLCATTHWWPFVFFLLPAATVHGVAAAVAFAQSMNRRPSPTAQGVALFTAMFGALLGLTLVWIVREKHMQSEGVGLVSPFAFPPLALLAEFAFGTGAAGAVLMTARKGDAPLLASEGVM